MCCDNIIMARQPPDVWPEAAAKGSFRREYVKPTGVGGVGEHLRLTPPVTAREAYIIMVMNKRRRREDIRAAGIANS